jgi:hypothetical protein
MPTIWDLPNLATPTADDLIVVVDDPLGVPTTKHAKLADVLALGGGTVDVLHVGPDAPTDPTIELWADTDAVAPPANPFGDVPLDQSTWSWVNQGTATVTQASNVVFLLAQAGAGQQFRVREQVMPTPPFTVTARIIIDFVNTGSPQGGLCLRESATGKLVVLRILPTGLSYARFPGGVSSGTGAADVLTRPNLRPNHVWFRLRVASGTITASYALDGVNFWQLANEAVTTSFTTAPDRLGITVNSEGTGGGIALSVMSWVQTA